MSPSTLFSLWQNLCEKILEPFPAAALVSLDGELLVSRYQSLADVGTLPVAAITCHQYFQIRPGDVILINDPYSGGSLLSSINLVTAVSFDSGSGKQPTAEALLVARIPFKPRVVIAKSVDGEGVRIPPTPLVQNGELNTAVLNAIAGHPMAPAGIAQGLERGLAQLLLATQEFGRMKAITGANLSKKAVKDWLSLSQKRFGDVLHDLSEGNARGEIALGGRSRIVLSVEVKDRHVSFNFTGSGTPERYALSDSATMGACVGALIAALDVDVPINAGVMRSVDVVAPLGSVVHARYPAPVFLGLTDGTALVAGLVLKLLGQIDRDLVMAQGGLGQCAVEIDFGQGKYFYDDLEPGSAAMKDRRGADALDIWRRTHLQRSIETIERMYPMRIRSVALRSDSGGSGQWVGGDGQTKVFEILAPAKLKWVLSRGLIKPEGVRGGKAAIGPEIILQRANQERQELSDQGEIELHAGDQIILHSAGGGGYGEAAQKSSESL